MERTYSKTSEHRVEQNHKILRGFSYVDEKTCFPICTSFLCHLGGSAKWVCWPIGPRGQFRRETDAVAGRSDPAHKHTGATANRRNNSADRCSDSCFAIQYARIQPNESLEFRRQCATIPDKPEQSEHSGIESERFPLRDSTGNAWNCGLFRTQRGIAQFWFVEFWFIEFWLIEFWLVAIDFREQSGKFSWNFPERHAVPSNLP